MMKYLRKVALIVAILCFVRAAPAHAIEQQMLPNWCWVACIQDVLAQAGEHHSQPEIAARLDGWPENRPAYINELVWLLQSYGFRAWRAGSPGSPPQLFNTLVSGWKLIAFVRPTNGPVGHYIVLQGIDPNSGGVITSDPANGSTFLMPIPALYQMWRWMDSVVVGTPQPDWQ